MKKRIHPITPRAIPGFSLIEILLAFAILMVLLLPLTALLIQSYGIGTSTAKRGQAVFYAQEAMEAAYNVLAHQWETTGTGNFHPEIHDGSWALGLESETLDGFEREIRLSLAKRDEGTGNLSASGEEDLGTKKVEISVTWPGIVGTNLVNLTSYYSETGSIE